MAKKEENKEVKKPDLKDLNVEEGKTLYKVGENYFEDKYYAQKQAARKKLPIEEVKK